jgi:hypothetical protein
MRENLAGICGAVFILGLKDDDTAAAMGNCDFAFVKLILGSFQVHSSILVLLESCLQTCMTYTIAECTVNKLLMMDRGTVRNM